VDTPEGLKALTDTIKQLVQKTEQKTCGIQRKMQTFDGIVAMMKTPSTGSSAHTARPFVEGVDNEKRRV
jgi:hypothetical protein